MHCLGNVTARGCGAFSSGGMGSYLDILKRRRDSLELGRARGKKKGGIGQSLVIDLRLYSKVMCLPREMDDEWEEGSPRPVLVLTGMITPTTRQLL